TDNLKIIQDYREIKLIMNQLRPLLESDIHFDQAELHRRSWTSVPVQSASHFGAERDDVKHVCDALKMAGHCFALLTQEIRYGEELVRNNPKEWDYIMANFEFEPSIDTLFEFSFKCGAFNYAITNDYIDFVIAFTTSDYYLIAGPRNFVEIALGKSIDNGLATFHEYAQHMNKHGWPGGKTLLDVVDRYSGSR